MQYLNARESSSELRVRCGAHWTMSVSSGGRAKFPRTGVSRMGRSIPAPSEAPEPKLGGMEAKIRERIAQLRGKLEEYTATDLQASYEVGGVTGSACRRFSIIHMMW